NRARRARARQLIHLLYTSREEDICVITIRSLGHINIDIARATIVELLNDPRPAIRRAAMQAIVDVSRNIMRHCEELERTKNMNPSSLGFYIARLKESSYVN